MKRIWGQRGLALRMLCAVALLFLSFAHRPVMEIQVADASALAYQLPDGSAPDLCVPQSPEQHKISYPACDACRLSASVILPPAPAEVVYVALGGEPLYIPHISAEPDRREGRSWSARGPPSFLDA